MRRFSHLRAPTPPTFSAEQFRPRTARAVAFAIGVTFLTQMGFMAFDLAIRKLLGARVSAAVLDAGTCVLLALGTYVGVSYACSRYPLAGRTAIFWGVAAFAVLLSVATGAGGSGSGVATMQVLYVAAEVLGAWIATALRRKPDWLASLEDQARREGKKI